LELLKLLLFFHHLELGWYIFTVVQNLHYHEV
jgi:hypothetical protein